MLTFSPSWLWREARLAVDGQRSLGIRFRFPVSIGAYEFAALEGIGSLRPESIDAISVVPGTEIEIPMTERWRLKALGFAGLGKEAGGAAHARIFRLGFRSRYDIQIDETQMSLVSSLERMGFSDADESSALNMLSLGLDFSRTMKEKKFGDTRLVLHWHVSVTDFGDRFGLDATVREANPVTTSGEWELGFAFGKLDHRIEFGPLKLDRIGMAYRLGSGGDLTGIGIVFRSLFDR